MAWHHHKEDLKVGEGQSHPTHSWHGRSLCQRTPTCLHSLLRSLFHANTHTHTLKPALTHTRKIHSLLTDISRCNPVDQSERERKTEIFQINHPTVFTNAPGGKEILRDRDREKEKERERERKRERLYWQVGTSEARPFKCFSVCPWCQHLFHTHPHLKAEKDVSVTFSVSAPLRGWGTSGREERAKSKWLLKNNGTSVFHLSQ